MLVMSFTPIITHSYAQMGHVTPVLATEGEKILAQCGIAHSGPTWDLYGHGKVWAAHKKTCVGLMWVK